MGILFFYIPPRCSQTCIYVEAFNKDGPIGHDKRDYGNISYSKRVRELSLERDIVGISIIDLFYEPSYQHPLITGALL